MPEAHSSLNVRPLVTFALFAYNQENYIREAVEGAFSQTYSPLEIILSDDFSNDRTFAIMQEMARSYMGTHKVILNRNDRNFGIGGHVNKINSLASGEMIVVAAGDDISKAERTSILVDEFKRSGASALTSSEILMSEGGDELSVNNRLGLIDSNWLDFLNLRVGLGCGEAWSKALFSKFGDMEPDILNEDVVIGFRAVLCGGLRLISEPLVYRRQNVGVSERKVAFSLVNKRKHWKRRIALRRQLLQDAKISGIEQIITVAQRLYEKDLPIHEMYNDQSNLRSRCANLVKSLCYNPKEFVKYHILKIYHLTPN